MQEFTTWRGFDLAPRIAKIRGAFNRQPVVSADEVPILINAPYYFSFGSLDKPSDYYTNPASMLAYQAAGFEKHLRLVNDDLMPYFMPWFGTGVLASGFGAAIRVPEDPADDPAVAAPCIQYTAGYRQPQAPGSQSRWLDAACPGDYRLCQDARRSAGWTDRHAGPTGYGRPDVRAGPALPVDVQRAAGGPRSLRPGYRGFHRMGQSAESAYRRAIGTAAMACRERSLRAAGSGNRMMTWC